MPRSLEFDIIIIGAGSAGCVLASELALRSNHSILLLEAGGKNNSAQIHCPIGYGKSFTDKRVNWMEYSTPDGSLSGRNQYVPRGKGLGGSSAINAMVYTRGFDSDFDRWDSENWTGDIFRKAYDAIEHRHGENSELGHGPLAVSRLRSKFHPLADEFAEAARALGISEIDMVDPQTTGFGDYRFTIFDGKRVYGKSAFLDRAKSRKNLKIMTKAMVHRIEIKDGKAHGVKFYHKGRTKIATARGRILLCAGAYHTPQILQLSGIGDNSALGKLGIQSQFHNPNVGANLQDHLAISYHYRSKIPTLNAVFGNRAARIKAGLHYKATRNGPFALSVNQMGAFVQSSPARRAPDFQIYFNPMSFERNVESLRAAKYPSAENGFILCFNSCRPTSQGSVSIASHNPNDPPLIRPNYLASERDQQDVLLGAQIIKSFELTTAMTKIIEHPMGIDLLDATAEEIFEDFKARAGTVFHPCGTAKMDSFYSGGVVDEELNVYGVKNLKVVDASVFPKIPSANIQAPVMALAWIAVDRILSELKE